ncbi:MAG TPA: TldD/PmbA family protein, partial [Clostridiaceae bacterium]|nr:TldD/PmbA family protein [Clostridiaceae bacterium]
MDVLMSNFLNRQKAAVKELVQKLSRRFSYVSVLGTDTLGKRYDVKKTGVSIKDSMWTERGFVARIYNGVNYFEYSFNDISGDNVDEIAKRITEIALDSLNNMKGRVKISSYPLIQEKEIEKSYTGQVGIDPADVSDSDILKKLNLVKDEGLNMSDIV